MCLEVDFVCLPIDVIDNFSDIIKKFQPNIKNIKVEYLEIRNKNNLSKNYNKNKF